MKFNIRIDAVSNLRKSFSVFVDGELSGKLWMNPKEADEFIAVLLAGCTAHSNTLVITDDT